MATKEDEDKDNILKDGEHVRVPLMLMDSVQRSIAASTPAEAIRATTEAMRRKDAATFSHHRHGYRLSVKMMKDNEARDALADAYGDYETSLTNAWRNASPEPESLLDAEFDDEDPIDTRDAYQTYDAELSERWKTK